MAKYIITRINKATPRTKVAKERVEFKIWPLLVCFFLAFCVWLYIAGEEIRHGEQPGDPSLDGYSRAEGTTDGTLSDLNAPAQGTNVWDEGMSGTEHPQPGASS
ncbi:MAG: hypothetical protein MJ192_04660 [Clostridia bacterium]|nr:hypothetical protein [Clostridia bacterium]